MNKLEGVPDSYNIRNTVKDIIETIGNQHDGFLDFEEALEGINPSVKSKFKKDGSPTHWINTINGAGVTPQEFPFFSHIIMLYNYYFIRKRVDYAQSQLFGVIDTLKVINTKLDTIQQNQKDLTNQITNLSNTVSKVDSDLSSKMTKNVQIINQNTDNDANKVIKALP